MNQLIISAPLKASRLCFPIPGKWASFRRLRCSHVHRGQVRCPDVREDLRRAAEAIEGGIAKAEKAQAEASAALEEYKQQLTDARAEANRIREEARAEGAQILADLKEKAAAESARITAQAHAAIQSERQAAVVSLRSEVGTLATTLAGRIVGESLEDDARSARVVDRFLADLENQNAGAAK